MEPSPQQLNELSEREDVAALRRDFGSPENLAKMLSSDPKNGIVDSSSVQQRIKKYGSNELPDRPMKTFFELLAEALSDNTLIILIICATVSLFLEIAFSAPGEKLSSCIDGIAILSAVAIVSVVQSVSNFNQEKQFVAVNRIKSIYNVGVMRGGHLVQLKNDEIVVGDVVQLEQGDRIPADGIILTSDGMRVDQSVASGESVAVSKNETDPFLISNTHVVDGRGSFLVTCVGTNSLHGRVFSLLSEEEQKPTPLQIKLEALARQIGNMGMIAASLTFGALFLSWIFRTTRNGWKWSALKEPLDFLVIALTIVVVAVPEGLPLAVTISLAYSMKRMMSDNNFVRRLAACETMGSVTVILTDKTGTLTMNEMNVEHIIIGGNASELIPSSLKKNTVFMNRLKESLSLNTHAVVDGGVSIGSQTECALIRYVSNTLRHSYLEERKNSHILKCFQFDRIRKRMSTVVESNGSCIVYTKGAPEMILPFITSFYDEDGDVKPMNDHQKKIFLQCIDQECHSSYRSLAVAFKETTDQPQTMEEAETNLTLLAVFSIRDSLRPNTVTSIATCQKAGIKIIMVTGDHLITAEAIANDCGILKSDTHCITGSEIRGHNPKEMVNVLNNVSVIARSTPMDKHAVVSALQSIGEIVAVTGDGTNDVPALMAANVGLSMGKTGTELAKEASDIVILDDDFRSIVRSVVWGRGVSNNIRRFLQFQLTANIVTLFVSFISAVILNDTPFKAVQLLWVNMIMDSLGALALATGIPSDSLLNRPPQKPNSPLISKFMWFQIGGQSILQVLLVGTILAYHPGIEGGSVLHYTFLFTVFVLCQAVNLTNCRASEPDDSPFNGLFQNPLYSVIQLGIVAVQILLVEVFPNFFSCCSMSLAQWSLAFLLSFLSLPVGALARHFFFLKITGC